MVAGLETVSTNSKDGLDDNEKTVQMNRFAYKYWTRYMKRATLPLFLTISQTCLLSTTPPGIALQQFLHFSWSCSIYKFALAKDYQMVQTYMCSKLHRYVRATYISFSCTIYALVNIITSGCYQPEHTYLPRSPVQKTLDIQRNLGKYRPATWMT